MTLNAGLIRSCTQRLEAIVALVEGVLEEKQGIKKGASGVRKTWGQVPALALTGADAPGIS